MALFPKFLCNLAAIGKMGPALGFDYGREQSRSRSSVFNKWYTPVAILRYEGRDWAVAARAEYYSDQKGVIVPLIQAQPFQMKGYSVNVDKKIFRNALWPTEGRLLSNRSPYFEKANGYASSNFFITTAIVIDFIH